ncbi:unnamed protein product, partial [Candidula unifasciata]
IFPVGWTRTLNFVVNIIKAFNLGRKKVQVAFGIFSTKFEHRISLGNYTDHEQFTK